jgi:ankyrin repeat protein
MNMKMNVKTQTICVIAICMFIQTVTNCFGSLKRKFEEICEETELYDAIEDNNIKAIEKIINNKYDRRLLNTVYHTGNLPLHKAVCLGRLPIVKLLLDARADVNKKNRDYYTSLHWAAHNGHEEVINILLDNGAHINARRFSDENSQYGGDTPLYIAAQKGNKTVVEMLLQKNADINIEGGDQGYGGILPLEAASQKGHVEVVKMLLEKHNDDTILHKFIQNPLIWEDTIIIETLLKAGIKINTFDNKGRTPLALALVKTQSSGEKISFIVNLLLLAEMAEIDNTDELTPETLLILQQYQYDAEAFKRDFKESKEHWNSLAVLPSTHAILPSIHNTKVKKIIEETLPQALIPDVINIIVQYYMFPINMLIDAFKKVKVVNPLDG